MAGSIQDVLAALGLFQPTSEFGEMTPSLPPVPQFGPAPSLFATPSGQAARSAPYTARLNGGPSPSFHAPSMGYALPSLPPMQATQMQPLKPLAQISQALAGDDPQVSLGLGLLAAGGPSPHPISFGQALLGASGLANQRQQQREQQQLIEAHIAELAAQQQERSAQQQGRSHLGDIFGSLAQAQAGNTPALTPQQADFYVNFAQADPRGAVESFNKNFPGVLGPAPAPKLSEFGEKARDYESRFGPLSKDQALRMAGGAAPDAKQDPLDRPLAPNESDNLRLPDGSKLPLGVTLAQAQQMGAKGFSEAELERQHSLDDARRSFAVLKDLALGRGNPEKGQAPGVFVGNGGSVATNNILARSMLGTANAIGSAVGTDASIDRDTYNNERDAFLSKLARAGGEKGALSDPDVARIGRAIPKLGAAPVTEQEARQMFDVLQNNLFPSLSGSGNSPQNGSGGAPEYDFDPRTGRLVPRR